MIKYLLIMNKETADTWGFEDGEITTFYPGENDSMDEGKAQVVINNSYETPILRTLQ